MDFTDAPRRSFTYSGANGMKVPIWLEGEPWFLNSAAVYQEERPSLVPQQLRDGIPGLPCV